MTYDPLRMWRKRSTDELTDNLRDWDLIIQHNRDGLVLLEGYDDNEFATGWGDAGYKFYVYEARWHLKLNLRNYLKYRDEIEIVLMERKLDSECTDY